jgi:hypothetical protein
MRRHGDYRPALPFWRTDFGRFLIILAFVWLVIYCVAGPIELGRPSPEAQGEALQWSR